jgi:hypothetical protein
LHCSYVTGEECPHHYEWVDTAGKNKNWCIAVSKGIRHWPFFTGISCDIVVEVNNQLAN